MTEAICAKNVSLSFGNHLVLDELTASFEVGKVHIIMGASGIGKTSFMMLLLGLLKPDKGEIEGLDGLRIRALFQEDRLAENLSCVANVRLASGSSIERAKELLSKLGLQDELAKPVRELSGGQKRRVSLARALAAQADVVCFDEPLSALDDDTKDLIAAHILEECAGKTLFWITHDKDDLERVPDAYVWQLEGMQGATMARTR